MDEHLALLDEAHHVRQRARRGRPGRGAFASSASWSRHLDRHVRREEDGIFARAARRRASTSTRWTGSRASTAGSTPRSPRSTPTRPTVETRVAQLFDELADHVEREDLGIFPVSVVTLGAAGWELVDRAHAESPSFLPDPARD